MSVDELHLGLRLVVGDEQRLGHGLTRDRVVGRNQDSFAVLVFDASGTWSNKFFLIKNAFLLSLCKS